MTMNFLDFEKPIAELEAKIDELRFVGDDSEVNLNEEISRLQSKSRRSKMNDLTLSFFRSVSTEATGWLV